MVDTALPTPLVFTPYASGHQATTHDGQGTFPRDVILVDFLFDISITDNLPIEGLGVPVLAEACHQYVQDYYFRIHVSPSELDLGNLLSSQLREFTVWNAFFVQQTLDSLTVVGDASGIVLTEPFPPPTIFGGLESRTYQLDINTVGAGSINVTYTFDFLLGQLPALNLLGNRIVVFAYPPDWSDMPLERLEWLTQIIESDGGVEKPNRLRVNPRRTLEYTLLLEGFDKRWFEAYMWSWKANIFAVPLWTDCASLTGPAVIDDLVLNVSTDYFSFVVGGSAILVLSPRVTESVEIESLTSSTLTLARPLLANWGSGSKIYPVFPARLDEEISINHPTADITQATLRFKFIENVSSISVDSAVAYQGGFVLEKIPNRADDLQLNYDSKYGLVDYGIGDPMVDDRAGFPDVVTAFQFVENDRAEIWFWREWLAARAGRWSHFYIASQSLDFIPLALIADSANSITVEDTEYRNFYNLAPGKRDIAIYTFTNGIFYRRINSATAGSPGEELLGIDAPLGVTVPLADIQKISYLHPARLDSDAVEIAWDHDQMARIAFSTRVLPL